MSELFGVHGIVVAIAALVLIGPKDLPKALRMLGYWTGKARGIASQFRQGFDNMVREAELAELEKKWREENERIMREHPADALPAPEGEPLVPPEQPLMVEHPVVAPAAEPAPSPPADAASS